MSTSKEINQYNAEDKAEGYWEKYFDNGQLWLKGNYINGNADGLWEIHFPNGRFYYKGNYNNGKQAGWWGEYYERKLITKTFYVNI